MNDSTRRRRHGLCVLAALLWTGLLQAIGPVPIQPGNGAVDLPGEVSFAWEVGSLTNLIQNGGFENRMAGWLGNVGSGEIERRDGFMRGVRSTNAAEGAFLGSLQVTSFPRLTDIFVFQTLAIPNLPATARLSWRDFTTGGGNFSGTFHVVVTPTAGVRTPLVVHESVGGFNDTEGPWNSREADLTAFIGRTVIVEFGLTNRFPEPMGLRLDDVRLDLIPTNPVYELFVGPTTNLVTPHRVARTTETSFTLAGVRPGTTNYWRVDEILGTRRAAGPVFRFVTAAGPVPPIAPVLTRTRIGPEGVHLEFATEAGRQYRLERTTRLEPASWENQGITLPGDGLDAVLDLPEPLEVTAFFRVVAE
jgi:hypothetical protein